MKCLPYSEENPDFSFFGILGLQGKLFNILMPAE